ncbi:MAG: DUF1416 domain-containing protein [Anaerolineae bacterium]|nr:MAG: DUF1416 domain-containing protein [Anaerolineae bacterium]
MITWSRTMKRILALMLMIPLLLAACGPQEPPTPRVEDIQTAIAQTEAARPTATNTPVPPPATFTPAPSNTPAPTATATSSGPITGVVNVEFLNLREGPGTLFDVMQPVPQGEQVLVIGQDESGDWVQVQIGEETDATEAADDPLTGWFAAAFLNYSGDPTSLPVVQLPFDQQVRVTVQDTNGNPIPGVVVAVIYRDDTVTLRNDSTTNDEGRALAHVPPGFSGVLDVQIVGIDCTSPIVDINCELSGYFVLEWRTLPVIPQTGPIVLRYEVSTTVITGSVVDRTGNPVAGIEVVAQRDDGAETAGTTGADGTFRIPAGPGIWEVFALVFDPRREGARVTVEIADTAPEPVTVIAP